MKACPFCSPENCGDQIVVFSNDHCMFLREPQEVLTGSGVIVPKQHRETVFDLTEDEWAATFDLLRKAKELLDREYRPQGYSVGWNVGKVGGQEIPHAHLHVIPRYEDEPLAGKGIRYWLKQSENRRKKSAAST